MSHDEPEVLVVGAGPVGMTIALVLARQGRRVEIVDAAELPAAQSYALALHPATLELFADLGLVDELLDEGHRVDVVAFYEGGRRTAAVHLDRLASPYPFLLVIAQRRLEEILEGRLAAAGVAVGWGNRLSALEIGDDGPRVVLEQLRRPEGGYAEAMAPEVAGTVGRRPAFVIGADGHRSETRRALGIDHEPVGATALVATFEFVADRPDDREVRIVLSGATTSVLWPLGGGRWRWSFELTEWPAPTEDRDKARLSVRFGGHPFPWVAEESLEALAAERAPWFDSWVEEVVWSAVVRFEARLATAFGRDRVWLAGDAAHLADPVAVHSLNVGCQEGAELASCLGDHLAGAPPELERWGHRRTAEWRTLFGLDARVGSAEATSWASARAVRIASCLPVSGVHRGLLLAQLGLAEAPPR